MKPFKRVDVSKLNPEQRAALAQLIRDCQQSAPDMKAMQDTAKQVFAQWLKAPQWGVAEADREDLWHVGAPAINYVDHIEGT